MGRDAPPKLKPDTFIRASEKLIGTLLGWRKSPLLFVRDIWGLEPQVGEFIKGKHLTWQQVEILQAVEKALAGGSRRIAVSAGRGVGKTATVALVVIWYLFTRNKAQIGCTAPSSTTLFDVLWKECIKWIQQMPSQAAARFDWTQTHIRMKGFEETWFARFRTARKETPEALAGLHGESVLIVGEESSGIDDDIFKIAEGSLTGKDYLFIIISNPRRLIGYFHDCFFKDKANWQTLSFSALDSPLVDWNFVKEIKSRYGEDSDEYSVEVLGKFPRADAVDSRGYVPLFTEGELKFVPDQGILIEPVMGVDPAGEGTNKSTWVVRDQFKAKIVAEEDTSDAKSVAQKTISLAHYYSIPPRLIVVDAFGAGMNVAQELALSGFGRVNAVNVGEKSTDERYLNLRAECFWKLREWVKTGGEFVRHPVWKEQLLSIRYRPELSGKLRVMDKATMRREGYASPDAADGLALTFYPVRQRDIPQNEDSSEDIARLVNIY